MRVLKLPFVALGALSGALLLPCFAWAGGAGNCMVGGTAAPEPASLSLLGVGVGGVLAYRYYRSRRK